MAQAIVKRVGGKHKLADWIISHFPPHSVYCEPFGGSFAVGLRMPTPKNTEYRIVYNDEDKHISNFFKILRDKPEELINAVNNTPYSRNEFEIACSYIENIKSLDSIDCVEWARNFIIFNRQSMFGKEEGTWTIARQGENSPLTWNSLPLLISQITKKLKSAYIECDDYKKIFERWDSEQSLMYIDPPYVNVEHDFYHVNKKEGFDHKELAKHVKKLKGSWAISYYDSEFVRELYDGYTFYAKNVKKHMQTTEQKAVATEILIVSRNEWSKHHEESLCFPDINL